MGQIKYAGKELLSSQKYWWKVRDVTKSGKRAAKSVGVKFFKIANGKVVYEVGSGVDKFEALMK